VMKRNPKFEIHCGPSLPSCGTKDFRGMIFQLKLIASKLSQHTHEFIIGKCQNDMPLSSTLDWNDFFFPVVVLQLRSNANLPDPPVVQTYKP
jgi:hypothetical protein